MAPLPPERSHFASARHRPWVHTDGHGRKHPTRSPQLVSFVEDLQSNGVAFKSLTDVIDTTTPAGGFFFHVMAALAEMERDLLRERTRAGLAAAKARGREGDDRPSYLLSS